MPFKKPTFNVNTQPQFGSRLRALRQRNAAGCHRPDAVACIGDPRRSCLIPPAGLRRWEAQERCWEGSLARKLHRTESSRIAPQSFFPRCLSRFSYWMAPKSPEFPIQSSPLLSIPPHNAKNRPQLQTHRSPSRTPTAN